MNLRDYIDEAISSGKHNGYGYTKMPDPRTCTISDILDWFKSLGIKGKQWGDEGSDWDSDPPVNPGELAYYVGPCSNVRDTNWISLFNNVGGGGTEWTEEICVWLDRSKSGKMRVGRLTLRNNDPVHDITIGKSLEIMSRMIENPNKIVKPNGKYA